MPAFNWPIANFPRYKYPLYINEHYNKKQDEDCLKNVINLILQQKKSKKDVAAVIVEPIQSEGGDYIGSPFFFNNLQSICKENGVVFIVDEVIFCFIYNFFLIFKVQTGGGSSGTFWAHEQWNLSTPPDIVTFSKKTLIGGYYYKDELKINEV